MDQPGSTAIDAVGGEEALGDAVDRIVGLRVAEFRHDVAVAQNDAVGCRARLRQCAEHLAEDAHLVFLEVPLAAVRERVVHRQLKLRRVDGFSGRRVCLPLAARREIRRLRQRLSRRERKEGERYDAHASVCAQRSHDGRKKGGMFDRRPQRSLTVPFAATAEARLFRAVALVEEVRMLLRPVAQHILHSVRRRVARAIDRGSAVLLSADVDHPVGEFPAVGALPASPSPATQASTRQSLMVTCIGEWREVSSGFSGFIGPPLEDSDVRTSAAGAFRSRPDAAMAPIGQTYPAHMRPEERGATSARKNVREPKGYRNAKGFWPLSPISLCSGRRGAIAYEEVDAPVERDCL